MPIKWYTGQDDLEKFLGAYTGGKAWNDPSYAAGYDLTQWQFMNSQNQIIKALRGEGNTWANSVKANTTLQNIAHASKKDQQSASASAGIVTALTYATVAKAIHQPGKDHFSVLCDGYIWHLDVAIDMPRVVVGMPAPRWTFQIVGVSKGDAVQDFTVGEWSTATGSKTKVFKT